MSLTLNTHAGLRSWSLRKSTLAMGLVSLLVGEVLVLTLRFDTTTLSSLGDETGWLSRILQQSGKMARVVVPMAAGVLILGGERLRAQVGKALFEDGFSRRWQACLVGHVLALAGFSASPGPSSQAPSNPPTLTSGSWPGEAWGS